MFSGIGGFEIGIQRAMDNKYVAKIQQDRKGRNRNTDESGICILPTNNTPLCIGYSEIDKYAIQIYEKHFGGHKNYGNATNIIPEQLPDFDLLVGGFPCQAFSIAGKRRGFEDTRGTLFFDIARILKVKQPRFFLLENVKGLLNHDKGETFTTIIKTIDELGYDAQWQVLNSKHYGVPQNRERVFIIGHLRGTSRPKVFPITGSCGSYPKEITSNVSDAQRIYTTSCAKTLKGMGGGQGAKTGLYAVLTPDRPEKRQNDRRIKDENEVMFTLTGQDKHGILDKRGERTWTIRRLTPIECERLQGFPDNWTEGLSDTQRYKTLGNAVTVNVIEAIMRKIIEDGDKK